MIKWITRLTTVFLALLLALPIAGCQQKDQEKEKDKVLDVQVDAGNTKVKVEGTKKSDGKEKRIDVDVERHSDHEKESGESHK